MEQSNKNVVEEERRTENPFAETLAMELMRNERGKHMAKNLGLWLMFSISAFLVAALVYSYTHFSNKFYQNDKEWRELFGSYDYVSQDGNGQNYYNSDIGGNVNNGAESKEAVE